jgi:hypothetical protein
VTASPVIHCPISASERVPGNSNIESGILPYDWHCNLHKCIVTRLLRSCDILGWTAEDISVVIHRWLRPWDIIPGGNGIIVAAYFGLRERAVGIEPTGFILLVFG